MKQLSVSDVMTLHRLLIRETGGTPGLRDQGLLESAVNSPYQTFGGIDIYPNLPRKAAQLGFGLIQDHPFLDGNKRIGILAMLTLLEWNGILTEFSDQELVAIGLDTAGGKLDAAALEQEILSHASF